MACAYVLGLGLKAHAPALDSQVTNSRLWPSPREDIRATTDANPENVRLGGLGLLGTSCRAAASRARYSADGRGNRAPSCPARFAAAHLGAAAQVVRPRYSLNHSTLLERQTCGRENAASSRVRRETLRLCVLRSEERASQTFGKSGIFYTSPPETAIMRDSCGLRGEWASPDLTRLALEFPVLTGK